MAEGGFHERGRSFFSLLVLEGVEANGLKGGTCWLWRWCESLLEYVIGIGSDGRGSDFGIACGIGPEVKIGGSTSSRCRALKPFEVVEPTMVDALLNFLDGASEVIDALDVEEDRGRLLPLS